MTQIVHFTPASRIYSLHSTSGQVRPLQTYSAFLQDLTSTSTQQTHKPPTRTTPKTTIVANKSHPPSHQIKSKTHNSQFSTTKTPKATPPQLENVHCHPLPPPQLHLLPDLNQRSRALQPCDSYGDRLRQAEDGAREERCGGLCDLFES